MIIAAVFSVFAGVFLGGLGALAAGLGGVSGLTFSYWAGLVLICFLLPGILSWAFGLILRRIGWIKENDLKLD